mmetsp:Transcript_27204/g.42269  ORF Transcript_27204/g.42269 Transcript_27204/m.42269 type:complete len:201 (-) Transcript_27204:37-639(-)
MLACSAKSSSCLLAGCISMSIASSASLSPLNRFAVSPSLLPLPSSPILPFISLFGSSSVVLASILLPRFNVPFCTSSSSPSTSSLTGTHTQTFQPPFFTGRFTRHHFCTGKPSSNNSRLRLSRAALALASFSAEPRPRPVVVLPPRGVDLAEPREFRLLVVRALVVPPAPRVLRRVVGVPVLLASSSCCASAASVWICCW